MVPTVATELLDKALVAGLTVIDSRGAPVTYPLIPLWDGEKIYMTSSILFSKKLEHIKANNRVAVSVGGQVVIQGTARVIEDDLHDGWSHLLPLWRAKEPIVDKYLKQRFALPLFWERAVIEITPIRIHIWDVNSVRTVEVAQ